MVDLDTKIVISLSLRDWQVVCDLLDREGKHHDVRHILDNIFAQAGPQAEAAEALERAAKTAAAPSEATQPADAPRLN